jgi:membrane-bound ClpP family serine protease
MDLFEFIKILFNPIHIYQTISYDVAHRASQDIFLGFVFYNTLMIGTKYSWIAVLGIALLIKKETFYANTLTFLGVLVLILGSSGAYSDDLWHIQVVARYGVIYLGIIIIISGILLRKYSKFDKTQQSVKN